MSTKDTPRLSGRTFFRRSWQSTSVSSGLELLLRQLQTWTIFRNNQVDVVRIDANHDLHYVRSDAYNSLRHLPNLKYMVSMTTEAKTGSGGQ